MTATLALIAVVGWLYALHQRRRAARMWLDMQRVVRIAAASEGNLRREIERLTAELARQRAAIAAGLDVVDSVLARRTARDARRRFRVVSP